MDKNRGNFPTRFPAVFPSFSGIKIKGLHGTAELFPGGTPLTLFKEEGGVLRKNYFFYINILLTLTLNRGKIAGKTFPRFRDFFCGA